MLFEVCRSTVAPKNVFHFWCYSMMLKLDQSIWLLWFYFITQPELFDFNFWFISESIIYRISFWCCTFALLGALVPKAIPPAGAMRFPVGLFAFYVAQNRELGIHLSMLVCSIAWTVICETREVGPVNYSFFSVGAQHSEWCEDPRRVGKESTFICVATIWSCFLISSSSLSCPMCFFLTDHQYRVREVFCPDPRVRLAVQQGTKTERP